MLSSTDSTITVRNNKNIETTITKNDIKTLKKRRFSITKTALLPVGVAAVGIFTILAVGEGSLYNFQK